MKHFFFAGLFIIIVGVQSSFSQDISYVEYRNLFPDEDLIILSRGSSVEIKLNDNFLHIIEESKEKKLYLNEEATRYNKGEVGYNSFEVLTKIEASTKYLDGIGKYKNKQVSDFETKDVLVNGIFYGDNKTKSFLFPNTSVGSITELGYRKIIKNPRFLNPFTFNSSLEVMESTLEIVTDDNVKLGFKIFGDHSDKVIYDTESLKRGRTKHTWKGVGLPKVALESNSLSQAHYRTHVIPFIEYYVNDKKDTVRISGTVDDLYNWYSILVENIVDDENTDLENFISQLRETSSNDEDLIRNIYSWVQQNIDYIAIEDGYGGFIPRGSSLVYNRKYGDCKDMANLLKKMLELAGFENVYLTWIGTREKPYSYFDLPTPLVDNHMITMVDTGEKIIYLDATNSYTPYGLPSSFIQGKEALIGKSMEEYEVLKVPVVDKEINQRVDSLKISFDGNALVGRNKRYLSGYRRIEIDYALERVSPKDYDVFFNNYLAKGNNKFIINSIDYSQLLEKRIPETEFSYSFTIPDYARSIRNKVYINPILDKSYIDKFKYFDERELDYVEDYKFLDKDVISISIPPGYEVDYLPESRISKNDKYGFSLHFSEGENEVVVKFEIYHDFLVINKNEVLAFKTHIDLLSDMLKETISFKKITN